MYNTTSPFIGAKSTPFIGAKSTSTVGVKASAPTPVAATPKITTTPSYKPVAQKAVTAAPVAPAAPTPKITYSQLQNRGGTIVNKATGQGYSNPSALAADLGTSNVDWSKISGPADYANLQNQNGTIVNTATGQKFANPTELANELGTTADKIDWAKITKQDIKGVGNNPYTVNQGLQGELITSLANQSSAPGNVYTQATKSLLEKSQAAGPEYTAAYNQAQEYNKQLGQLAENYGTQTANIEGSPIDLTLATGQQGILQRLYAAKQGALAGQYQGATNLMNAANTQQALQQQGLTSAAGASTAQQGVQQTGLGTAAGLTAPIQVPYSNQLINPVTGQSFSTGNSTVDSAVAGVAAKVKNGTMTYADAVNAVSGYGQAGSNALTQALQGTDIVSVGASAAAKAANIGTGGTAATTASNQVYQDATKKFAEIRGMASNIKEFGNQLQSNMKAANINPSDSSHVNMSLNQLASEFNSKGYAAFAANIQGLQARVSALLGTGELPSVATGAAQAIINGNMSLGAMESAINQINNEAAALVNTQATIASDAYKNLQGGTSTGTGGGTVNTSAGAINTNW
jgi:hypothetical protein